MPDVGDSSILTSIGMEGNDEMMLCRHMLSVALIEIVSLRKDGVIKSQCLFVKDEMWCCNTLHFQTARVHCARAISCKGTDVG